MYCSDQKLEELFSNCYEEIKNQAAVTTDIVLVQIGEIEQHQLENCLLNRHNLNVVGSIFINGCRQIITKDTRLYDTHDHIGDSDFKHHNQLACHDVSLIDLQRLEPMVTTSNSVKVGALICGDLPYAINSSFIECFEGIPWIAVTSGTDHRQDDICRMYHNRPEFSAAVVLTDANPMEADLRIPSAIFSPKTPVFISTATSTTPSSLSRGYSCISRCLTHSGLNVYEPISVASHIDTIMNSLNTDIGDSFSNETVIHLSPATVNALCTAQRCLGTNNIQTVIGCVITSIRKDMQTAGFKIGNKVKEVFTNIDEDDSKAIKTAVAGVLKHAWTISTEMKKNRRQQVINPSLEKTLACFAFSVKDSGRSETTLEVSKSIPGVDHLVRKGENRKLRQAASQTSSIELFHEIFPPDSLCLQVIFQEDLVTQGVKGPCDAVDAAVFLGIICSGKINDNFSIVRPGSSTSIVFPVLMENEFSVSLLGMDYRNHPLLRPLSVFCIHLRNLVSGKQSLVTSSEITLATMKLVLDVARCTQPQQPSANVKLTFAAILFILGSNDDIPVIDGFVDFTSFPRPFKGPNASKGYKFIAQMFEYGLLTPVFRKQLIVLGWRSMTVTLDKNKRLLAEQHRAANPKKEKIHEVEFEQFLYHLFQHGWTRDRSTDILRLNCRKLSAEQAIQLTGWKNYETASIKIDNYIRSEDGCYSAITGFSQCLIQNDTTSYEVDGENSMTFTVRTTQESKLFNSVFPQDDEKDLESYFSSIMDSVLSGADLGAALQMVQHQDSTASTSPDNTKIVPEKPGLALDCKLFDDVLKYPLGSSALNALFDFDVSVWKASGLDPVRLASLVKVFVTVHTDNINLSIEQIVGMSGDTPSIVACNLGVTCSGAVDVMSTTLCTNPKCSFRVCRPCLDVFIGRSIARGRIVDLLDIKCGMCTAPYASEVITPMLQEVYGNVTFPNRFFGCSDSDCKHPDKLYEVPVQETPEEAGGGCQVEAPPDVCNLVCSDCSQRRTLEMDREEMNRIVDDYSTRGVQIRQLPCCGTLIERPTACFHITCHQCLALQRENAHVCYHCMEGFKSSHDCYVHLRLVIEVQVNEGFQDASIYNLKLVPVGTADALEYIL